MTYNNLYEFWGDDEELISMEDLYYEYSHNS